MKSTINKLVYPSKIMMFLISHFFRIKNKKKYNKAINERISLDILKDYDKIGAELPYFPFDFIPDNNLYGLTFTLKSFLGMSVFESLDFHFEHGLYLGGYVAHISKISYAKGIITLGENREKHLLSNNLGKEIVSIGPYILYADSLINNESLKKLKNKLGKTLLVFPSHSIKGLQANYDEDIFLNKIKNYKKDYETILACMYYIDLEDEILVEKYKEIGATIVCAGHKYDCYFLSRLKTIIELSDYTISNTVGTHIGYCIAMNKKHKVILQETIYEGKNQKENNIRNKRELDLLSKDKAKIMEALEKDVFDDEVIDFYWGAKKIKSKEDILNILNKQD